MFDFLKQVEGNVIAKAPEWCSIGKTVYGFDWNRKEEAWMVQPEVVTGIEEDFRMCTIITDHNCYTISDISKILFATQEEAVEGLVEWVSGIEREKALEKEKEEKVDSLLGIMTLAGHLLGLVAFGVAILGLGWAFLDIEGFRTFVQSAITIESAFRLSVVFAVLAGALTVFHAVKLILYIKWEMHPEEIGRCVKYMVRFGLIMGILIYISSNIVV